MCRSRPTAAWWGRAARWSIPTTRGSSCSGSPISAEFGEVHLAVAAGSAQRGRGMRRGGGHAAGDGGNGRNDLAGSPERRLAEFEQQQVGPGARPLPHDLGENLRRESRGVGLRQQKGRRRGRARNPGMAVDQQMRVWSRRVHLSAEIEQGRDILAGRRDGCLLYTSDAADDLL